MASGGVTARFDETIHAPLRLRVCAMLDGVERARFSLVRDALGVSDSVLSKHATTLQAAGYLTVVKEAVRGRVLTDLALTPAGRAAYRGHVAALRAIVADAPPADATPPIAEPARSPAEPTRPDAPTRPAVPGP